MHVQGVVWLWIYDGIILLVDYFYLIYVAVFKVDLVKKQ